MARYRITHKTTYAYSQSVSLCHNQAQMVPRESDNQSCLDARLTVEPAPAITSQRADYFGNRSWYFAVQTPHQILNVTAESTVDMRSRIGPAGSNPQLPPSPSWETARDVAGKDPSVIEYTLDSPHITAMPVFADFAADCFTPGKPLLEALWDLNCKIHREMRYQPGATSVSTTTLEAFMGRKGVCQDFSHLALACLRSLGLPARYVSGYVESAPAHGPRLTGADASHAWFAGWIPELGWMEFDPTNCKMPDEQHITISYGRDYADIAPLRGIVYGGGRSTCRVAVTVAREN